VQGYAGGMGGLLLFALEGKNI